MAFAVRTTWTVTGDDFRRIAERQVDLKPFNRRVGLHMLSQGLRRLTRQVQPGQFRTPGLRQSLNVGGGGGGTAETIYEVSSRRVSVGSTMPHAAIHQRGGVIRPVRGKALAIPLVDRLKRSGQWPRDFARDELQFIPAKKGGGVIGFLVDAERKLGLGPKTFTTSRSGQRRRVRRGGQALFMLVRQVTRHPRPYLFFDAADEEAIGKMLTEYLEEAG